MRDFTEQATTGQPGRSGHAEQQAIHAADLAAGEDIDVKLLEFRERGVIDGGAEDPGFVFRAHLGGHGGEGENAHHAELAGGADEIGAELGAAGRWLGLAEENDEIALFVRIAPQEQAAAWQARGDDEPVLHFHLGVFKEAGGREFQQQVHAELGHEVVTCGDGDAAHAGPDGHQPRIMKFLMIVHDILSAGNPGIKTPIQALWGTLQETLVPPFFGVVMTRVPPMTSAR